MTCTKYWNLTDNEIIELALPGTDGNHELERELASRLCEARVLAPEPGKQYPRSPDLFGGWPE